MKKFYILILIVVSFSGCVAVPVYNPYPNDRYPVATPGYYPGPVYDPFFFPPIIVPGIGFRGEYRGFRR